MLRQKNAVGKPNITGASNSDFHMIPLLREVEKRYETIIDGGTCEHIFNISQSLVNAAGSAKVGGNILHFFPANNFCGHGMYQVSPELFYSLYSEGNGFSTQVFLAKYTGLSRYKYWYRVERPANGNRIEFASSVALCVIAFSKKDREIGDLKTYQSDYVDRWENNNLFNEKENFSLNLRSSLKFLAARIGLLNTIQKLKATLNDQNYVNFNFHSKITRVKIASLFRSI